MKDFKYIIKRVIIGILIGLFFVMFKSCNVNAWSTLSLSNSNSKTTYQFGTIKTYGVNSFYLDNNINYTYAFNNTEPISISFRQGAILKNIEFEYVLAWSGGITFDSSMKYVSFNYQDILNKSGSGNSNNYLKLMSSIDSLQSSLIKTNFYNWQPIIAQYHDVNNDTWVSVDLKLYSYSANSSIGLNSQYIMEIPTGTKIDKFKLCFGTLQGLVSDIQIFRSHIYGDDYYNSNQETWFYPYTNYLSGSGLFNNTNEYKFLAYIPATFGTLSNLITLPSSDTYSGSDFAIVAYNSSLPSSDKLKTTYYFNGVDYGQLVSDANSSYQEEIQEVLEEIEREKLISGSQDKLDSAKEDLQDGLETNFSDFGSSTYGSAFNGLFTSTFAYPLEKIENMLDEDIYYVNQGGNRVLNLALCTGHSVDDHWGSRWQVHITEDYYFEFPCPHYDIYPYLKSKNHTYQFYGSSQWSFQYYYTIIIRGILVYWLFITCLNIYKYVLDPNDTKVEVLEL